MRKFSLTPFLLIKVLFGTITFLVLGSLATVMVDTNSLTHDISAVKTEIEQTETEITSREECFPDCSSQYRLSEKWLGLQSRLTYFEGFKEQSFVERVKTDIQYNDFLYFLVVVMFCILLLISLLKMRTSKRV